MQATIKRISLENFKGVKSATYQFDGKNIMVRGQNGAGKTTLFTGFMWLMADKDSDLKSNPSIRPLDTEECTPRVEVVFDIDGKEITAAKIQKCTVKKSKTGGADTVSLSNSYEVNSVEYGERDFKKKMAEYGFDFDLFLPLSHPDVFTSQKSEDMRKVLFGMASEQSDFDIALQTDDCVEATNLLKMYTFEEVKAMQNATLRKIREEYGKDGEILRAKIEGMEQSKTDIDVAELESQKNSLNEQIAENKSKQEDVSKEFEEQQRASDGVIELRMELSDLQRKANEDLEKKRGDIGSEQWDCQKELGIVEQRIKRNKQNIEIMEDTIKINSDIIKTCREDWIKANGRVFDENSLVCQYCGQEFPAEKKEQLREEFESHKAEELETVTKRGNELKSAIDNVRADIKKLNDDVEEDEKTKSELETRIAELESQYNAIPQSVDISGRPEVQEIQRQIAEKEQAMNKGNSAEEIRDSLKCEEIALSGELMNVEKQLALAQKNVEIDEDISKLRQKQKSFEQQKADCEKVLFQLDLVSRKKNGLLQEDINSHFELVDFKLFDWLKNGEYKEVCVPQFKGKDMGVSTNTGLEILMKLDVIKGLQRHYDMFLPIFVDGAEALDRNSIEKIEMDCQCIFLSVVDEKELKIVTE